VDEEPLPLATYATILAHLVSHRGQPLDKVLAALGVTPEQLEKADAYFNERLRGSHRQRKGILAMTFAAAFAEARKGQGLFTHGAPPVFGAHAGHAAPESSALPSYMTASPPVAASAPGWQAPPPVSLPVPVAVSVPVATPTPAAVPAPAPVPPPAFAPSPPPAPAVQPPSMVNAPPTTPSGIGTGTQLPASDAPRLPDTPWDQVASRVGKLTLAHYAALTIELSRNPADLTPLLQRYGLSSQDDLRHVNAAFQTQMSFDPSLRAQFDALIGRMRSMSAKRD
jgi:hypothetical protein